jgi:hypothetical protein
VSRSHSHVGKIGPERRAHLARSLARQQEPKPPPKVTWDGPVSSSAPVVTTRRLLNGRIVTIADFSGT